MNLGSFLVVFYAENCVEIYEAARGKQMDVIVRALDHQYQFGPAKNAFGGSCSGRSLRYLPHYSLQQVSFSQFVSGLIILLTICPSSTHQTRDH